MKTLKPTDLYDQHADAAMDCCLITERIEKLKADLDNAEKELLLANAKYADAWRALHGEMISET